MASSPLSRRTWLLSSAAALSCGRPPKARGYPGYCLVANQLSRSVAIVDLTNFRRLPPVTLDAAPSLVLSAPERKAFVLAPLAGTIYEIDATSLSVTRRVRAGNEAVLMKLAADALWVLYRDPPSLVEIAFDSLRPRRRIRLAASPDDFDLSLDPVRRAAIVSRASRTLTIASLDRSTVERTVEAAAEPTRVCFQWDGKQVIAASRSGRSVTIFEVSSGNVVVRLPLPMEPRQLCFNSDGGQLFVTGDGMDAVVILYPYQTEVAETVLAGRAPAGMAVSGPPSGSYLLVTNPETNRVAVLDIETRKLVSIVEVGRQPRGILVTPDQQYALVLNETSGDLAVIRLYSLSGNQAGGARVKRYRSAPLFALVPVGEKPVSAAVVTV